jgi:hypothetical protein
MVTPFRVRADRPDADRPGENLESSATQAFQEIHAAMYGCPSEAAHTWRDGAGLLLVFRTAETSAEDASETAMPTLESIQQMVSVAVLRRTGQALLPLGRSRNVRRRLAVLAFAEGPAVASAGGLSRVAAQRVLGLR